MAASSASAKEMFDLYDKTGDGFIELDVMDHVVRSLNFNPTFDELAAVKATADPSQTGYIDFATFQSILSQVSHRTMNPQELNACFSVFDRNDDQCIQITELSYALTNLGNKVNPDSVDELVQEAQIPMTEAKAPYSKFIQILTAPL